MLEVRELTRPGLHPASFRLSAGDCLTLRGPSGSGKTLLMRALADLDPTEGEVLLDGISRMEMLAPDWRRKVAYVPAESGWWAPKVGDHFARPVEAKPYLSRIGMEDGALDWPVSRLSTGEKQRLALLRSVVLSPEYLLLDEPTSALDETAREQTEALIHALVNRGAGLLLITHDADQAERFGGQKMHMEAGVLSGVAS